MGSGSGTHDLRPAEMELMTSGLAPGADGQTSVAGGSRAVTTAVRRLRPATRR